MCNVISTTFRPPCQSKSRPRCACASCKQPDSLRQCWVPFPEAKEKRNIYDTISFTIDTGKPTDIADHEILTHGRPRGISSAPHSSTVRL